jgi:hypothetical protein
VIDLRADEIQHLADAADQDWSSVEPHIFGTLFERLLDPAKRSQIGAHYTSSEDIRTLLEPVMMAPLRREWSAVKEQCEAIWLTPAPRPESRRVGAAVNPRGHAGRSTKESKPRRKFNKLLRDFLERLAHVTVLDPACGSGNFLYVVVRLVLRRATPCQSIASSRDLVRLESCAWLEDRRKRDSASIASHSTQSRRPTVPTLAA